MASTSRSGRGEQEHDPFSALEPPNKTIKSPLTAKQYDVFINHRGPDTKTTLAQQLYHSLQHTGIRAYLDAPETELGDCFSSAIKNAIRNATVHIAILSPKYAESAWCLAELALMFQTKARIIPLFYNVQPSDFRYIKNGVADAFSEHEKKGRYPNHDIEQWKECLQNVSGIKGYEINGQNDDPSELCNEVVSAVLKEKQKIKIPLQVAKYDVGLAELVKDFHCHCHRNGEMRGKIIGIFGMGGSGKTTLAKYLFNHKYSEFSGSTILFDVRENHVKSALTSLQSKLLNELFPGNQHSFTSIEEGTANIKHELRKSQESSFLIVIDDVDHQRQLDALLPIDALNPNSLVIVTTRDERLLIKVGVKTRYKMKEMNPKHSRELFCWNAFHRQGCKSEYENLVESFVEACGGLPLSLQVMGGHVFGSGMAYWKSQLDEVNTRLDKDIKDTLKISYDALEEDQKQIFMDIACFFIGENVSQAVSIWKASGWRAEHALQTLKDKCLVEVQDKVRYWGFYCHFEPRSVLKMHDHLRDLGREMADKETGQPTDNQMSHPRRLWRPEDLIRMSEIEGFQDTLEKSEGRSFRCYGYLGKGFFSRNRYFLGSSKASTDLQWLDFWYEEPDLFIPECVPLQNLYTLSLHGVSPARLLQRDDQVLLKLKDLCCSISDSKLQDTYMSDLYKLLSSFGRFKNLESLCICFGNDGFGRKFEWNCLLTSVRQLTNLQTLRLEKFGIEGEFALSNRGNTTDDRFRMRSLEAILLCHGCNTTKVFISGQFCPALKSLKLCSMRGLIEVDLIGVTTLECLTLLNCRQLRNVMGNDLLKLEIFHMKLCLTIRQLPNFGRVSCLKRIYISRCRNLEDISAVETLKGLERIWIAHCPELKSIKAIEQLKGLKRVWIEWCEQVEGVICLKELKELKRIFIGYCARLQNMEGVEFLKLLESISIVECPKLKSIRGVEELEGLKQMIISDSAERSCVERLQRLPSELTILVGELAMLDLELRLGGERRSAKSYFGVRMGGERRLAMSYFGADEIRDTLSMVDAFREIEWKDNAEEIVHSFQTTHHSFGTFIFCGLTFSSPRIGGDILHGPRIMKKKMRKLCTCRNKDRVYTCVFNGESLSKYDSWIPASDQIEKAFIMGVEAGEERKTLHILQTLIAQLYIHNSQCDFKEGEGQGEGEGEFLNYDRHHLEYDDLADYADDDEENNGGADDDHDHHNVSCN